MHKHTVKLELAAGDVKDIYPIGASAVAGSMVFINEADGKYSSIPDGAMAQARDDEGKVVFRLTAAAPMNGWIHIEESLAIYPDPVVIK